ncbi:MAG: HD domain-containing protein [Gemmatimonadetes bacterium]|nr:HD domain-containing protein [Gemmatimonadota bacterium]
MSEPRLPSWAVVSDERRAHIERVANLVRAWAAELAPTQEELNRWLRATYFHDALKDAASAQLRELAQIDWEPEDLLHGPAAASIAESEGESDAQVLDAVRYHSAGYAGWDDVGKVLYMADYLEPGRNFDSNGRESLIRLVAEDFERALFEVARGRVSWVRSRNWPLLPETSEFWNALLESR